MEDPYLTPTTALWNQGHDYEASTTFGQPRMPALHIPPRDEVNFLAEWFSNCETFQFYKGSTRGAQDTTATDGSSASTYLDPSILLLSQESSRASFTSLGSETSLELWNESSIVREGYSMQVSPASTTEIPSGFESAIDGTAYVPRGFQSTISNNLPMSWPHGPDVKTSQAQLPVVQNTSTLPPKPRRLRKKREPPSADEAQHKREAFLARNRIAAHKSRSRKRSQTEDLVAQVREAQEMRRKLEMEYRNILQEVMLLREEAARRLNPFRCKSAWNMDGGSMPVEEIQQYWIPDEATLCGLRGRV